MPLVSATGWGYRHPGRARWPVHDATFQLEEGSLTVVLGASGSGKSTLLLGLAGLLGAGDRAGTLICPDSVGFVGQEPQSNIVLERLGDDIAFGMENRGVAERAIWPQVAAIQTRVGLKLPTQRDTTKLSGGQAQLLALAGALACEPELLALDEPTANLDPAAAERVVAATLAARAGSATRRGCAVVVVEHRVAAWLPHADNVLLLRDGEVNVLTPVELPGVVAADRDLAEQVWLGPPLRPPRPPRSAPGPVVLQGQGVALAGRLAPIDVEVRSGQVLALVGPPGSGKSTLLGVLAGLNTPTTGTVKTDAGENPWRWPAAQVSREFGIVFQDPADQFLTNSARTELGHGLAVAGVVGEPPHRRVELMLERLGLAELAQANPFTLSGGQARRLSVGTALICQPEVLVLDEPTFGQDPGSWAALAQVIADHRDRGGAVVLATHDPHLVAWLGADEVTLTPAAASPTDAAAPAGLLRRLNPLALLAGASLLSAAALASRSVATNLLLAGIGMLLGWFGGAPRRRVLALLAPAVLAAASAALSNAMLAPGGITAAGNWAAAALPASRVLAVAVPGLVAAVSIDPTALADALTQQLRVPARPAYAVLAGLRLLPLLGEQWTTLRRANRARGLAGTGIGGRAREFASLAFRLLVAALRRGAQLALALDARGLTRSPASGRRTVARPQRLAGRDGLALAACVLLTWGAWLLGGL